MQEQMEPEVSMGLIIDALKNFQYAGLEEDNKHVQKARYERSIVIFQAAGCSHSPRSSFPLLATSSEPVTITNESKT